MESTWKIMLVGIENASFGYDLKSGKTFRFLKLAPWRSVLRTISLLREFSTRLEKRDVKKTTFSRSPICCQCCCCGEAPTIQNLVSAKSESMSIIILINVHKSAFEYSVGSSSKEMECDALSSHENTRNQKESPEIHDLQNEAGHV